MTPPVSRTIDSTLQLLSIRRGKFEETGVSFKFLIRNKAIISVLWHQVAKNLTVQNLEDMRLYSSLRSYHAIIVL